MNLAFVPQAGLLISAYNIDALQMLQIRYVCAPLLTGFQAKTKKKKKNLTAFSYAWTFWVSF